MALASGLAGQIMYVPEVTPGTLVTVTQPVPLRDESVKIQHERLRDPGIRANRRTHDPLDTKLGRTTIAGSVKHSLYNKGLEAPFTQMFGSVVKTGAGPYVRTGTPGDLAGDSMSVQIGRPGSGGTVHPVTLGGCKYTSWELRWAENEIVEFAADLVAMNYAYTTPTLATATYPASMSAFSFLQATTTVAGSAVKVKSGSIKCEMGLDVERRFAGSALIEEPLEADLRTYTIELNHEFVDLTHWDRHAAGTNAAIVVSFTAGADSLVITANADYDEAGSNVAGRGILQETTKYTCMNSTDATALTAVMTNTTA